MTFSQLLNLQYLIENLFISPTQEERHLTFPIFLSLLEESVYISCGIEASSRACLSLTLHLLAVVLPVCLSQGGADSISEIFQCKATALTGSEWLQGGRPELPCGSGHPERSKGTLQNAVGL